MAEHAEFATYPEQNNAFERITQDITVPWGPKIKSILAVGRSNFIPRITRLLNDAPQSKDDDGITSQTETINGTQLAPWMDSLVTEVVGKVKAAQVTLQWENYGRRQAQLSVDALDGSFWDIIIKYGAHQALQEIELEQRIGDDLNGASRTVTARLTDTLHNDKAHVADIRRIIHPAGVLQEPIFLRSSSINETDPVVKVKETVPSQKFMGRDKVKLYFLHSGHFDPNEEGGAFDLKSLEGNEKKAAQILLTTDPEKLRRLKIEAVDKRPTIQTDEIAYVMPLNKEYKPFWRVAGARQATAVQRQNGKIYEITFDGSEAYDLHPPYLALYSQDHPYMPAVDSSSQVFGSWVEYRAKNSIVARNRPDRAPKEKEELLKNPETVVAQDLLKKSVPDLSIPPLFTPAT